MLTKSQPQTTIQPDEKNRKIEIGQLKLNKETVKELTTGETKLIRGGNAKCHSTYAFADVNGKPGKVLT